MIIIIIFKVQYNIFYFPGISHIDRWLCLDDDDDDMLYAGHVDII